MNGRPSGNRDERVTTLEIEIACSKLFNPHLNMIVPNVWWGLGFNHECDLLVCTKGGYCTEIEIKISKADLKRDGLKRHGHGGPRIRRVFFAIPERLLDHEQLIPETAGIITVKDYWGKIVRNAMVNKEARPLNGEEHLHLGRLASMRIWTLKQSLKEPYRDEIIYI